MDFTKFCLLCLEQRPTREDTVTLQFVQVLGMEGK